MAAKSDLPAKLRWCKKKCFGQTKHFWAKSSWEDFAQRCFVWPYLCPLRHLWFFFSFETFDQSDEKTWLDPKRPTFLHTYPPTYLPALTEPLLILLLPVAGFFLATGSRIWIVCGNVRSIISTQNNPGDLRHLRHWLQFWQLGNWIHDNLWYLTIKSDSGQHSQFLRCFILCAFREL